MKRCPECDFLYEDDQSLCDMDGMRLRNTGQLPPLPVRESQPKSRWGGLMIPLLAGLVLSAVLFILYNASPRTLSSADNSAAKPVVPASGRDSKLPVHQPGPNATGPAPAAQPGTDPFAHPDTKTNPPSEKSNPAPLLSCSCKNSDPREVNRRWRLAVRRSQGEG